MVLSKIKKRKSIQSFDYKVIVLKKIREAHVSYLPYLTIVVWNFNSTKVIKKRGVEKATLLPLVCKNQNWDTSKTNSRSVDQSKYRF